MNVSPLSISIPGRLTLIPFAICTGLVAFQLEETLDRLLILSSAISRRIRRLSRHIDYRSCAHSPYKDAGLFCRNVWMCLDTVNAEVMTGARRVT